MKRAAQTRQDLDQFPTRKVQEGSSPLLSTLPDSLDVWITQYLHLAVIGVRSPAVMQKIALHLTRFLTYFRAAYGHDRISTCLKRDVAAWQQHLQEEGLAHSTINDLDLDQVEPCTPEALRTAHKAKITRVKGKGKTERTVFLSVDARSALADYLERERHRDASPEHTALFLTASSIVARSPHGRISLRAFNLIMNQIGRWHDAEQRDPARHISPLRPHDLRHTFAFQLAKVTNADAYELERRLGHRSQRYIQRYTNPPEHIAATYIEGF